MKANITSLTVTGSTESIIDKPGLHGSQTLSARIKKAKSTKKETEAVF